jgi:polyamine oxidase
MGFYSNMFTLIFIPLICGTLLAIPACGDVVEVDVLILGAGITGITAGNHLQSNNIKNFLILEAQDYIGGRIKPAQLGNVTVGEGANWILFMEEGVENPILTLANQIHLRKYMNREADIAIK